MDWHRHPIPGARARCEATAFHEAGHAVLGLLLGSEIVEARVDHDCPENGFVQFREPWQRPPRHWARYLTRTQCIAVLALAGPLAEAKLLRKPLRTLGAIGDLEAVLGLVRLPDEPRGSVSPNANTFFRREIRRTRQILNQPAVWRAVTTIAHDLVTRGSLNGDAVAVTLQWAIGDERQLSLFSASHVCDCF